MIFELLAPSQVKWEDLNRFEDRTVFQTPEWLNFLAETQRARPVVAELRDGDGVLGYFTGLTFRRMGIRILGSSFPGWTTPYMGFNLIAGVPRWQALQALETFAFRKLRCLHMEVADRYCSVDDGERLGLAYAAHDSYATDLTQTEEELFSNMASDCRRSIRKAAKNGVRIEEATDAAFADDFYSQLKDVFAKQNLVPTYGHNRVKKLIEHLLPTGNLLLLRARDPDGHCIATGIFVALNKVAEFWGSASLRSAQHFRPNEALAWHGMRYWKQRGIEFLDWGGGGTYKEKFGVSRFVVPRFYKSRFGFLALLRNEAAKTVSRKQRLGGWFESWLNRT